MNRFTHRLTLILILTAVYAAVFAYPVSPTAAQQLPPPDGLEGQDVYIEAAVEPADPYVGQQVTYVFRIYYAVMFDRDPEYTPPAFTGFWNPDAATVTTRPSLQAAGRTYQISERRTPLFPTTAGPVTIPPAALTVPGSQTGPGNTLQTAPVTLTVRPLPDSAPPQFAGGVGRFDITAAISGTMAPTVNQPLTLRAQISGEGNIDTLGSPVFPAVDGWRAFDVTDNRTPAAVNDTIAGSRVYNQLYVPAQAGPVRIPAIEYGYFNPTTAQYEIAATNPFTVTVAPEETNADAAATQTNPSPPPPEQPDPDPGESERGGWWVWALVGAGGLLLAVAVVWGSRPLWVSGWAARMGAARSVPDPVPNPARAQAEQWLQQAAEGRLDGYTAVGRALTSYAGRKLGRPIAGLTQVELRQRLRAEGWSAETVEQFMRLLAASDTGRYAPGDGDARQAAELVAQAQALIAAVEARG